MCDILSPELRIYCGVSMIDKKKKWCCNLLFDDALFLSSSTTATDLSLTSLLLALLLTGVLLPMVLIAVLLVLSFSSGIRGSIAWRVETIVDG